MGLIRVIVILLVISLISGAIRAFLAKRKSHGRSLFRNNNSDFIAEELYKLNELKNRGILTEEEYRRQKEKLLK